MNISTRTETQVTSVGPLGDADNDYYDYHDATYERYAPIFYGIALAIGVLGMIANSFAILVIRKTPVLRAQLGSILILSQCVCDLAASVTLIITYVVYNTQKGKHNGSLGEALCRLLVSETLLWTCFQASTFNLLAVTFERYLMVVFTLKHRVWFTRRKAYVLIALSWFLGILFTFPYALTSAVVDGYCEYDIGWPPKVDYAFYLAVFIGSIAIPLVLLIYAYTHILIVLSSRNRIIQHGGNSGNDNGPAERTATAFTKAQQNMTKIMVAVAVALVVCLLPNHIYFMCVQVTSVQLNNMVYDPLIGLSLLNCVVNPFIYSFSFKAFRDGARTLFCRSRVGLAHAGVSHPGSARQTDITVV